MARVVAISTTGDLSSQKLNSNLAKASTQHWQYPSDISRETDPGRQTNWLGKSVTFSLDWRPFSWKIFGAPIDQIQVSKSAAIVRRDVWEVGGRRPVTLSHNPAAIESGHHFLSFPPAYVEEGIMKFA
ncbi:hypothetical protein QE152_g5867 [Popillia japonica]|uniref:Uncharacterized protein n=1 Tax=Popillia japonica TaxID=7064 RepID=A0AAW1MLH8_POPJA